MRNAGIGSYSTAGGTEEPGKIRRAILYITPEIVNGCSTDIVAKGEVAVNTCAGLGIERIEERASRWHGAAFTCWLTSTLRGQYISFELE